jgi:hypothetical protein
MTCITEYLVEDGILPDMFWAIVIFVAFMIFVLGVCVLMRNRCREPIDVGNREVIGRLVLSVPENAVTIDVVVEN